MNCEKLNQDIAKLQTLRARFARKVDELNDTMRGKIEVRKIQEEVQGLEDQILEFYLADFKEKNPELFRWHLGEKIEGLHNIIYNIARLPDEEGMLVGGILGTLREVSRPNLSVDTIRQNLDIIIERSENGAE